LIADDGKKTVRKEKKKVPLNAAKERKKRS